MSNQRAFNDQLLNTMRTLVFNQEKIMESQSRMEAELKELKQSLGLGLLRNVGPIAAAYNDDSPPSRTQVPPFGVVRPTAKNVRALIFKQLSPDCPRDAVQDAAFDYREEHPELATTVDQLYLRTKHATDPVVAQLQTVVDPETSWSDVPKDMRVGAYLELESLVLSIGVDLRRCKDHWAAKCLVSTKWMNLHAYQKMMKVSTTVKT